MHPTWGVGWVERRESEALTVRFESVGYRTLALDLVEERGLLHVVDAGLPSLENAG
jgi:ATP-dependent DNA helicase RecQ